MSSNNHETIELEIEKMSLGGDGIAKLNGIVYFISGASPKDLVLAQITESKKNLKRGFVVKVIKAGPSRIQAPCPVYDRCGGCNWQHIDYSEQLTQKQLIIKEQLRSVINEQTKFLEISPSPQPMRYRNRIQLKFNNGSLGFFARKSHQIVDINDCLICEEPLANKISELKKQFVAGKETSLDKIEIKLVNTDHQIKVETVIGKALQEATGFSQVNRFQNEKMVARVLEIIEASTAKEVYDLYAGAGNFTFPILTKNQNLKLVSVEMSELLVQEAHQKIKSLNLSTQKIRYLLSDVDTFLTRTVMSDNSIVIIDPPRVGCAPTVIDKLAKQSCQKIIYISCNPSTLARDLQKLCQQSPWQVRTVQVFDMFPQTDHIETLVELTR